MAPLGAKGVQKSPFVPQAKNIAYTQAFSGSFLEKVQKSNFLSEKWNFIDFGQNNLFWKQKKIENPRQSFDKESIERDYFFYRIKKSSIAEEKKMEEYKSISPFSDSLWRVPPSGSGSPVRMDAH